MHASAVHMLSFLAVWAVGRLLLNIIRIVGLCWLNLTKWCTRVLFVGVSYRPDIIDCDDILSFEPS